MMKGDVVEPSKKIGHTLPPNVSSSFDTVELGRNFDSRNSNAPFQAGQTGSRAYF